MARFCPLFSSSSGNSVYAGSSGSGILIDAGVSCRQLTGALADRGIQPEQLAALFITHEHSDHVKGLRVFSGRFPQIPIYASAETLEYLAAHGLVSPKAQLHPVCGGVAVGDLWVESFETPHDAVHSLGYQITAPDGRKMAVATDLGHVSPTVAKAIAGADLVLLESNYEASMLAVSSYPYSLKQRIASDRGHLSNDCCARQAASMVSCGCTRVILGHLSRENNLPEQARLTTRLALEEAGMREGVDYLLEVAAPVSDRDLICF